MGAEEKKEKKITIIATKFIFKRKKHKNEGNESDKSRKEKKTAANNNQHKVTAKKIE